MPLEIAEDVRALPGSTFALVILTAINLLNFLDRYIPSSTKVLIKNDLGLSDTETAMPITAFLIVYMIASPVFAWLADRGVSRRGLLAGGIVLWSIATAGAYFAFDFWSFLFTRCFVGIGEAVYATIAPALLSDFYPPEKRNRALTIYYSAIPVGAALGFGLGGLIGEYWGWRQAFLVCGLPGVLVAALMLKIRDPGRGTFEPRGPGGSDVSAVPWLEVLRTLAKNRVYIVSVVGMVLLTFALGAMADWLPAYLERVDGVELDVANLIAGAATVVGGLSGTTLGGYIGERAKPYTKNAYMAVSGLALVPCVITVVFALLVPSNIYLKAVLIVLAQIFIFINQGPMMALIANSVSANIRARAIALDILAIHLFGDAISPSIIGIISDLTGSLTIAITVVPASIAAAAVVWLVGWRLLPDTSVGSYMQLDLEEDELSAFDDLGPAGAKLGLTADDEPPVSLN